MKYSEFLSISKNVTEKAGIESEPFLGTFMKPMKKRCRFANRSIGITGGILLQCI